MKYVKNKGAMGFQLRTLDPFIITMHHVDYYPAGTKEMTPATLEGKEKSWRMYYGQKVPGFPAHPHRGFETVTVVERGYVDHTDGSGAKGRYGVGDVQWMTAGSGMQHCEMFPLINQDKENTLELFQIWLNLDKANQMNKPEYKMLWNEDIPVIKEASPEGGQVIIKLIAGEYKGIKSLEPTDSSWAKDRSHHLGIWLVEMQGNSSLSLPAISKTLNRCVYVYEGGEVMIGEDTLKDHQYAELLGNEEVPLKNQGHETVKFLLLEGEPIEEPVYAEGPFVMTSQREIYDAIADFRRTAFGGWPHDSEEPVNPIDAPRFASHGDGRVEYPGNK